MGEKFETLLEKIGGWGRYQKIAVSLICLFYIPMGFFVFTPVFTYLTPPHRCFIPGVDQIGSNAHASNSTVLEAYIPEVKSNDGGLKLASCERFIISYNSSFSSSEANLNSTSSAATIVLLTEDCKDGWVYMGPEGRITATSEFDLVCGNAWKKPLLTSGQIIGLFLGSIISGPVTDKFGRKKSSLINMVLHAFLILVFSFASSYELLLVIVVAIGTSHIIWYNSTFVLVQELVAKNHRAAVACMVNVLYATGYMILPAVGYLLVDWRWIMRCLSLAHCLFLLYIYLLPESPRWLVSKGRNAEGYVVMSRIARVNGADLNVLDDLKMNNTDLTEGLLQNEQSKNNQKRRKSSIQILATNPVMRKRSLLICWIWNVSFLCYYALGYNTSNLGGSNYWNCFISAAVEIPCHFFVAFAVQKFGRRSSVSAYIGLAGAFLALSPALAKYNVVTIISAMIGKFFAASAMGVLYLYTSELYPTLLRNTGIGIASMSSRFGSVCAPFLVFAGENGNRYIPFYVMSSLGLVTCALCLFMPETKQSALPDTIADAIDLEDFRCLRVSCKKSSNRRESRCALAQIRQSRTDGTEIVDCDA